MKNIRVILPKNESACDYHRIDELSIKLDEIKKAINKDDFSLQNGMSIINETAATLLFELHHNRFKGINDENLTAELFSFIERVINATPVSYTYCDGIAGFGFFINYLIENEFLELDDNLLKDIDQLISKVALTELRNNNHDFLHGGLGMLYYLVNRVENNSTLIPHIKPLLIALEACASWSEEGLFWVEDEKQLQPEDIGKSIINLNVSHGLSSKIRLFALLIKKGVCVKQSKRLLTAAVKYLLNQLNVDAYLMPTAIVDDSPVFSHAGWCRGSLAISLCLWEAASVLEDNNLMNIAKRIALKTRERSSTDLKEAGICHGFGGYAHMYYRMYLNTKDQRFLKTANKWLDLTLQLGTANAGVAGYQCWNGFDRKWDTSYTLFSGVTGIGLVLLARMNGESSWDKVFMMS